MSQSRTEQTARLALSLASVALQILHENGMLPDERISELIGTVADLAGVEIAEVEGALPPEPKL